MLEEELEEMILMKQEKYQERQALRKRIGEVIHQMPFYTRSELTGYSEDEDEDEDEDDDDIEGFIGNFQFLPTEWLQKYFDTPTAAPMIDTSPYLCPHGRLDLDNITQGWRAQTFHSNLETDEGLTWLTLSSKENGPVDGSLMCFFPKKAHLRFV